MGKIFGSLKALYVKLLVWLGAEPPQGFEYLLPDATLPQKYTLKQGDTIFSVARKFGVNYQRIAQANGIKDLESIKPGQTLTIPAPDWQPEEQPTPLPPEEVKPPTKPTKPIPVEPQPPEVEAPPEEAPEVPIEKPAEEVLEIPTEELPEEASEVSIKKPSEEAPEAPAEELPEEIPAERPPDDEEPIDVDLPDWLEDVKPEEVEVEETPAPSAPFDEEPAPEHVQESLPDFAPVTPDETEEEAAEPEEEAPPEEEMVFRYEVQRGDTLNAIARRYGITVKELIEANQLTDSPIFPSQKLIIPGYRLPKIEPVPEESPRQPLPDVDEQFVYTVASGDTLGSIAKRYSITLRELIEANNLSDPNRIHVGQKLIIPKVLVASQPPAPPIEPKPTPTPISGIDPDFPPLGPANAVRALYTSYFAIGHDEARQQVFDLLSTTELNTVVIDAKSDYGWLSYQTQIARAREVGANRPTINDIHELLRQLKTQGIYTIARVVTFKDNLLAKTHPELAIKTQNGTVWQDNNNIAWSDPFLREVWDYNIQVAVEAARLGFDEIQFDLLRFPTVSQAGTPYLSQEVSQETRIAAITGFLSVAHGQLKSLGVKVTASAFGYACWRRDDSLIGQDIERMAPYLDVLCPMLYPSTFSNGIPGYKLAIAHPYEVVYQSTQRAVERIKSSGCTVRPWLQDFQDYRFDQRIYGREEIQAQIKACFDAGSEGFMVWNPQVNYTDTAYAPIAVPVLSPRT